MTARLLLALAFFATLASAQGAEPIRMFDGASLAGWRGDPRLWSVDAGAIRGSTMEQGTAANTFLIWEGGEVADFELTFEARLTPSNNSGVQYRSRVVDAAAFRVQGNQCDLHPNPPYLAMLYEEGGRGIVAQRGQQVRVDATSGRPAVVGATNPATPVDVAAWHRYRIVARGDKVVHEVDGRVAVEVVDASPRAARSGVIALQLHAGAPMQVWFRELVLTRLPATVGAAAAPVADAAEAPVPEWIWHGADDGAEAFFRRRFRVEREVREAVLRAAADNHCEVWLDGRRVLGNDEWQQPTTVDVTRALPPGDHVLAVRARNDGGPAGLAVQLWARHGDGADTAVVSDGSWMATLAVADGWQQADASDRGWQKARPLGAVGDPALVWSGSVDATAFGARPAPPPPQTVRPAGLSVRDGFVAELVYEVPRATQGSWVSVTTDGKGRLIASDQGDKGLWRITPAAIGVAGATTTVERIEVDIGGAQGLLWAFDGLYAVVNGKGSGLYRITDFDGDDRLDTVNKLTALDGAGEHGPHAVLLAPEGDALIVAAGNHTLLPEIHASRIPTNWGEDLLLPRQWDARGHAKGRLAPGGWICRVAPDGSHWEVLSIGYRNQYDIAFHRSGELFAYDADMEWDMGMPWYRPTRIVHATSGSEFGWRSGTGKWPVDYPDSLPPVLDIGPGSPTGVTFGYGAHFPTAYQDALFALDWTFGTIWAVHLEPSGASFRARREEFLSGEPLPLTDATIGADGALYFTVGGRGTQSALYRVRYVGDADTTPPGGFRLSMETALRRGLETLHGKQDPAAVERAFAQLGHSDRHVAYAARIALEAQPVGSWRARALAEPDDAKARNALLALARQGTVDDRDPILRALARFDVATATEAGAVALLRAMGVAMARHGAPSAEVRAALLARLEPRLPSGRARVDLELVKVLAYLGAPTVVERAVPLMVAASPAPAPAWAELIARNDGYGGPIAKMLADMPPLDGIDIAFALRSVRYGWTLPLRRQYFEFISRAAKHPGGASYAGFLTNCRSDALENCSAAERAAVADLTGEELAPAVPFEVRPPQGPGRAWTVDEAVAAIAAAAGPRDFAAGRNLFHAVACAACHRFDGAGGDIGPDLTTVANKFSVRDLLESIVEPSRVISDQYGSSIVTRKDGTTVFGRVVARGDGSLAVYTLDPNAEPTIVAAEQIGAVADSPISQMPQGLMFALNATEIADLVAFLMSRGDPAAPAYRR